MFHLFEVRTCFGKWNNHVVALIMSFLRVPLFTLISYYLLLYLVFCKAYQNCLVALIKITTVDRITLKSEVGLVTTNSQVELFFSEMQS